MAGVSMHADTSHKVTANASWNSRTVQFCRLRLPESLNEKTREEYAHFRIQRPLEQLILFLFVVSETNTYALPMPNILIDLKDM